MIKSAISLFTIAQRSCGTPRVESLTSFIVRVSEAHSVSVGSLIKETVSRGLSKTYLTRISSNGGTRFYARSSSYNGMGSTAEELVSLLETLTATSGLRSSTMIPFRSIVSSRNLMRPTQAWCPICIYEQSLENTLYLPLLWSLNVVTHCDKHSVRLSTFCQKCGERIPYLTRRIELGVCPHCLAFLGNVHLPEDTIARNDEKYTELIMGLLEQAQGSQEVDLNVTKVLDDMLGDGRAKNAAELARHIGVPKTTLWCWRNSATLPTLKDLLNIVLASQLRSDGHELEPAYPTVRKTKQNAHKTLQEIESELLVCLSSDLTMSLNGVAQRVGLSKNFIYKHFPKLARQIASAHRENVRKQAQTRVDNLVNEIRETTLRLHRNNVYPSRRKVEATMNRVAILREKVLQDAWRQTLQECMGAKSYL